MIKMAIILFIALVLRLYGINWDQGFHLHPDERMLIMVAERISFFKNLNPNFFNYGSLPIYLLRVFSPNGNYDGLLVTGRVLSVIFELITIFFIYRIAEILFKNKRIALVSSFLYSIAFFPIQNSHFFVVDVFLTTFTTILVYLLLIYWQLQRTKNIFFIAITFAAMLATKFTALIFYPIIVGIIFWKTRKQFLNLIISLFIFHLSFVICHFIFMPYAYLDFSKFFSDIKLQVQMNSNPYIFPYTLQYAGTLPYLYYLKNIFLWGLGPFISTLSLVGLYQISKIKYQKGGVFLFLIFYFSYFLIVGRSAVKFMRYMLPLYPFFSVLAGYGLYKLYKFYKLLTIVIVIATIFWSFIFISIYSKTHTRIAATEWILKNIPADATLAVEHWDDRLPIYGGQNFKFEELALYERPDDDVKWQILNNQLKKSDYLIIASNRLYLPLQKLADCNKYKFCYPKTAQYYKRLFNNQLNFKKVAEFSVSPLFVDDQSADESFTVYDHPKIMIYKNLH